MLSGGPDVQMEPPIGVAQGAALSERVVEKVWQDSTITPCQRSVPHFSKGKRKKKRVKCASCLWQNLTKGNVRYAAGSVWRLVPFTYVWLVITPNCGQDDLGALSTALAEWFWAK